MFCFVFVREFLAWNSYCITDCIKIFLEAFESTNKIGINIIILIGYPRKLILVPKGFVSDWVVKLFSKVTSYIPAESFVEEIIWQFFVRRISYNCKLKIFFK